MNRSTLDRLISSTGLIVGVVLLSFAGVLNYAHNFIHTQVHDQLSAQRITFPVAGSEGLVALPEADQKQVAQYAGQQLLTGAQAKVFANNYIDVHLTKASGGKTYSELSAAAKQDPTNAKLTAQVQTAFKGETLRGLLLNAYAFDTMAIVAGYAAFGALFAGLLLVVLAWLGYYHASRVATKKPARRK